MLTGSRISQHLRDCDHYHHHLGLGLGLCSSRVQLLSSFMFKPFSGGAIHENHRFQHQKIITSFTTDLGCLQPSKSHREIPVLSDCFCQREDDHEVPSSALSPVKGGIVALGKFDALHIGHRELAIQASKVGAPFLLSFVGIAEVLGWEPRAPIVAKCDRKRVLVSWAPYCGNVAPTEFQVKFSSVRHLTPQQFVEKLSKELGVQGVVAGENYRFGYRAFGDASELSRLCKEYGMEAFIINSVMDKNQDSRTADSNESSKERGQVSSTRVRMALAKGDVRYVSELLGRRHRLMLRAEDREWFTFDKHKASFPKSCLLNLPPKDGSYENCFVLMSDENPKSCKVMIDTTHVYLELDEVGSWLNVSSPLGIEFGGPGE